MTLPPVLTPAGDPAGFLASLRRRVPSGYVRLSCADPPLNLIALMGPTPPHYTAGFGGWEVTPRPRQVGMTTWQGGEPLALELELIVDGFALDSTVEGQLGDLYAVARGDDESPPGIVVIAGIPLAAERWVIEGLDIGEAILNGRGYPLRQTLTVTFREYVPPHFLQLRRPATQGVKGKAKTIRVAKGDTPASIARKVGCSWTDLRAMNIGVVTKANQNLKDGSKLRVPAAPVRERKAKGSTRSRKTSRSKRAN